MYVGWLRRLLPEATEATRVIGKLLGRCSVPALADPNLQIRGGGHPDPVIRGMGRSKNIIFWPFGPQFGPKIRGGADPPGPSPGSDSDM